MLINWNGPMDEAICIAFARLGYPSVKSEQLEAIQEFVKDKDVLPTGASKSLCYGCLPIVLPLKRVINCDTVV